ncbi:MAG: DUF4101 domain-containing protein [Chloroflexi bacterium]|nr:DUF4101 domain-containing protein [Chloroflexota bacterium]
MRRYLRFLVAVVGALAIFAAAGAPAWADQAPFWESPTGLAPGHPDIQVRMAAETVDIVIVEQGDEIHAKVTATFTMVNDGPEATLKVGFPASTHSLFDHLAEPDAQGVRRAESPGTFSAYKIRTLDVAIDGQPPRSWRQEVQNAGSAGYGEDWAMWEMTYPAGRTTAVQVTYDQVLTDRASDRWVQPMYVLRTGALWFGSIGEVTVTLRAETGGAFVGGPELFWHLDDTGKLRTYPRNDQVYGPADAAEASSTRVVWRFRDIEPARDAGATYVRSSAWRTYVEAEQAILGGGMSDPQVLRAAADAAMDIVGGPAPCAWEGGRICVNGQQGIPSGLVDALGMTTRERARRALQLAPDDPAVLQTFADVEFWYAMPTRKHHGELGCWPSNAVDAYERAAALGAPEVPARLEALRSAAQGVRGKAWTSIDTCSHQPDARLEVEMMKATVAEGNAAWRSGVGRSGTAEVYPQFYDGHWLQERTAEVAQLRRDRHDRRAELTSLEFTNVSLIDETTATIETVEVWSDRTYAESGQVVRDASGRLRQRYDLKKIDGQWKIVDGHIVRE